MSGSNINQTFEDDILTTLANVSSVFVSTLVEEASTITRRPFRPTTMTSTTTSTTTTTTTTPASTTSSASSSTTTVQRLINAVTTTSNFTDYMDMNGTLPDLVPGNSSNPVPKIPTLFSESLSNLDLIWIIPILLLILLLLLGLAFLLFYCIQKTELCLLRYCRCCFRSCKCCRESTYLLRDEHAKLTDDETNVLYMRELRGGRGRP